jgi:hypothetical protein
MECPRHHEGRDSSGEHAMKGESIQVGAVRAWRHIPNPEKGFARFPTRRP